MNCKPADEVLRALAEPFDATEIKFKPAVVSGNRAMALAYVDARVVQDRLDEVLGVDGWQDDYEVKEEGSVVCRLRCLIDGNWITKVDVGSPSEQPDGGDRLKAAFSDALKRAAVKFGVGRFLYRMPQQWCDYDAKKRAFVNPPVIPAAFRPQQPAPQPQKAPEQPKAQQKPPQPSRGEECMLFVHKMDREYSEAGHWKLGHLAEDVKERAAKEGWDGNPAQWTEAQVKQVGVWLREVKAAFSKKEPAPPKEPTTGPEILEALRALHREFPQVAPGAFISKFAQFQRDAKFPENMAGWSPAEVKVGLGWLRELREEAVAAIEQARGQEASVA